MNHEQRVTSPGRSPEQGGTSADELAYRLHQQELLAGFGMLHAATMISIPDQEDAIIVQDLHAALAKLPRGQRDAIMLVGAEGMAYEEAAAALGVNVGTLKSRVNRARNRLAELMGLIGEDGVGSSRSSSS